MTLVEILNQYGFATLAAVGMGWFIYFIYVYITREIKRKLESTEIFEIVKVANEYVRQKTEEGVFDYSNKDDLDDFLDFVNKDD